MSCLENGTALKEEAQRLDLQQKDQASLISLSQAICTHLATPADTFEDSSCSDFKMEI